MEIDLLGNSSRSITPRDLSKYSEHFGSFIPIAQLLGWVGQMESVINEVPIYFGFVPCLLDSKKMRDVFVENFALQFFSDWIAGTSDTFVGWMWGVIVFTV